MKILFLLIMSLLFFNSYGQDTHPQVQVKDTAKDNKSVPKVEIESSFRGGDKAWANFLRDNMNYPKHAIKKKIEGTIIVSFIVDKDGSVKDAACQSTVDDKDLRLEALRVINLSSGLWNPAKQNGRLVKSYKRQPIVFKLVDR